MRNPVRRIAPHWFPPVKDYGRARGADHRSGHPRRTDRQHSLHQSRVKYFWVAADRLCLPTSSWTPLSRGLKGPTERRRRGPRSGTALRGAAATRRGRAGAGPIRPRHAEFRCRRVAPNGGRGRTPEERCGPASWRLRPDAPTPQLAGGIGRHHRPSSGSPIPERASANAHAPPSWPALRIRCPCPRSLGGETTRSEGRRDHRIERWRSRAGKSSRARHDVDGELVQELNQFRELSQETIPRGAVRAGCGSRR